MEKDRLSRTLDAMEEKADHFMQNDVASCYTTVKNRMGSVLTFAYNKLCCCRKKAAESVSAEPKLQETQIAAGAVDATSDTAGIKTRSGRSVTPVQRLTSSKLGNLG